MSRNLIFNNALILRVRSFGESNREALFLTAEEGVVSATVFGGAKSKLRAAISPFHQGVLYLYHNPVKDSRKVIDFDVKAWRPGLRESFDRATAGAAVSGTVSATHAGGGDWAWALELASASLTALETADEGVCAQVFVHFLWNWLGLIGEKPSLSHCAVCRSPFEKGAVFSPLEQALICPACAERAMAGDSFVLGAGARRWLLVTEDMPPSQLARWSLDTVSFAQARAVVTGMLTLAIGKRLSIWDF
jgi:DNA repair protein RecO (recombination protein O)